MKRIHKGKTAVIVKNIILDEKVEVLRDNCNNLQDRASSENTWTRANRHHPQICYGKSK